MFTTLAYRESVDSSGGYNDITAVPGTAEYVQNGHQVLRDDLWLIAAYMSSAGLARGRIVSPSLRIVAPPQVRPITQLLLPPTDPNVADYRNGPIRLRGREEIAVEMTSATAGAEVHYCIMFCGDANFNVPRGVPYVIRATGATTVVAGAWTNVQLTFDDLLPAGEYEVIGMEAQGTTVVAARLVMPLQSLLRPGTLGQAALGGRTWRPFIDGGMGSFGRFVTTAMPSAEFLCNAADTAQTVFLKCIKVA